MGGGQNVKVQEGLGMPLLAREGMWTGCRNREQTVPMEHQQGDTNLSPIPMKD